MMLSITSHQEIQIKTTTRYHLKPVRMAIINKSTNNQCWTGYTEKGNPSVLLVGMQTGAATVENSMEFPQKTKYGTAFLTNCCSSTVVSILHPPLLPAPPSILPSLALSMCLLCLFLDHPSPISPH